MTQSLAGIYIHGQGLGSCAVSASVDSMSFFHPMEYFVVAQYLTG